MDKKAENVVQNVGAIAETTSIFYNTIIKQVPKDVAMVLTQHFMDLTMSSRRTVTLTPAQAAQAAALAEAQKRGQEKQGRARGEMPKPQEPDKPDKSDAAQEPPQPNT